MVNADALFLGEVTDYVFWSNLAGSGSTISCSLRIVEVEHGKMILNVAISRSRPAIEPLPNVQLCEQEVLQITSGEKY